MISNSVIKQLVLVIATNENISFCVHREVN